MTHPVEESRPPNGSRAGSSAAPGRATARGGQSPLTRHLARGARAQTLAEIVGGLADDLNRPLTRIVMRAEIVAEKLRLGKLQADPQVLRELESIGNEGHRAGRLIGTIRSLLRKTDPQVATIDLQAAIREAVAVVEHEMRHSQVVVEVTAESALPPVWCDKVQIQYVLLDLLRRVREELDRAVGAARRLVVRLRQQEDVVEVSFAAVRGVAAAGAATLSASDDPTMIGEDWWVIDRTIVGASGGQLRTGMTPSGTWGYLLVLPASVEERTYGRESAH